MTRPTRCYLASGSRGDLEPHGGEQTIEIVDDPLVQPIELMPFHVLEARIAVDRLEEPRGQRRVDAFEELEEDDTEAIAVREQAVSPRPRHFLHEALGAQFREVVAELRQVIRLGGDAQCRDGMGIEVGRLEGPTRGDVRESHEGVHEGQLPRMIQLQARDAFAGGEHRGLGEAPELATVEEGLEDVLRDIEVRVDDAGEPLA